LVSRARILSFCYLSPQRCWCAAVCCVDFMSNAKYLSYLCPTPHTTVRCTWYSCSAQLKHIIDRHTCKHETGNTFADSTNIAGSKDISDTSTCMAASRAMLQTSWNGIYTREVCDTFVLPNRSTSLTGTPASTKLVTLSSVLLISLVLKISLVPHRTMLRPEQCGKQADVEFTHVRHVWYTSSAQPKLIIDRHTCKHETGNTFAGSTDIAGSKDVTITSSCKNASRAMWHTSCSGIYTHVVHENH